MRSSSSGRRATSSTRSCRHRRRARSRSSGPSRPGPARTQANWLTEEACCVAREIYQAIVDGILIGGVYALMAVGLTLIFGVLDIIKTPQRGLATLWAFSLS